MPAFPAYASILMHSNNNSRHTTKSVVSFEKDFKIPLYPIKIPRQFGFHMYAIVKTQYFTVPHLFLQESCRNPVIPVEFQWNPQESTGSPLEFHWNKTEIKQTKVEILQILSQFIELYPFSFFPAIFTLIYICFSSQSMFTLPFKFKFK